MTDPLGGQSAAGGTGQSAGTTDPGTGTAPPAGGQSAPGTTGTTANPAEQSVSRAEFDQLRSQLAAADKARVAAEQAHAQLRDKDMPALQKAERDLQVATAALAERDALIGSQRVEIAFLTDNTRDWHNPGAALQLLDRSRITVDPTDGKVGGMKEALEALAKAHPYLLKPEANGGQGAGGTGTPPTAPPPGTAPANGGIAPPQGGKQTPTEMANRFPALRQRLGQ